METIRESVLSLAAFAALAGCAELLAPRGRTRSLLEAVSGLLAAGLILRVVSTALRALAS